MNEAKSNKIQILRGIAILAVVCIHTAPSDGVWQVFLRPFLNFAVAMFLFLSGFLSDAKKWNPRKRLLKVLIPYLLWSLLYTALYSLRSPSVIPGRFIENVLRFDAAGHLYYILVYCELTLLIPLIDKLANSKFKYAGLALSPIMIFILYSLPYLCPNGIGAAISAVKQTGWGWLLYYTPCWFTCFYLGYLLGNRLLTTRTNAKTWLWCWLGSLPLQMLEGYLLLTRLNSANCGTQVKLSTLLTSAFVLLMAYRFLCTAHEPKCRILKYLGDNAFGIYFSHVAIIGILSQIPYFSDLAFFPLNTAIIISVDLLCIIVGKKLLGKLGKYLAL